MPMIKLDFNSSLTTKENEHLKDLPPEEEKLKSKLGETLDSRPKNKLLVHDHTRIDEVMEEESSIHQRTQEESIRQSLMRDAIVNARKKSHVIPIQEKFAMPLENRV